MKFDLLEEFTFIRPGRVALEAMAKDPYVRAFSLAQLPTTPDRKCCWCNSSPLPTRRHRWCSKQCVMSGQIYCRPHSPEAKAWVLINQQNCACTICGLSYEDWIRSRLLEKDRFNRRMTTQLPDHAEYHKDRVSYFQIGYGTGEMMHVDHIVPLYQGGAGFGISNIQVICVECHRKKTISERAGDTFGYDKQSSFNELPGDWLEDNDG